MQNRVINNTIYLVVIKDLNPIYTFERATKCWQVLNKNMKIIKEELRIHIGGNKNKYGVIHTSYNVEETLLVLKPLKLDNHVPRKKFTDFKDFFDVLNKDKYLKYLVQRSYHELEQTPKQYGPKKDVDILVNDYYYFKSITGARFDTKYIKEMRENDNGPKVLNKINIDNCEIRFDIRFIGDNFVDSNWERNMINNKIEHKLKNNIKIYIPSIEDELYSLIYNILIQKPNPTKNKHIPQVLNLAKKINVQNIDFNNIKNIFNILKSFMNKNNYEFLKPHDTSLQFNINF